MIKAATPETTFPRSLILLQKRQTSTKRFERERNFSWNQATTQQTTFPRWRQPSKTGARKRSLGTPCESGFVWVDFSRVHPCSGGFWTREVAAKPRATSVGHFAEERCYGRGKLKNISDISRPFEATARCLELNWHFQGRKIFVPYSSEVWERLKWNEGNFCSFFFPGRVVQSSCPLPSS